MLLTRLTQRRILDAQREPCMPSEQAAHRLQWSVRRTNIIAHHEAYVCREVSRVSESVAVAFLAVKVPWRPGPDTRRVCLISLELNTRPFGCEIEICPSSSCLRSTYQN
ncbi:hypothetical protein ABIE52_004427 [Rhodococcus sp. OAS809]